MGPCGSAGPRRRWDPTVIFGRMQSGASFSGFCTNGDPKTAATKSLHLCFVCVCFNWTAPGRLSAACTSTCTRSAFRGLVISDCARGCWLPPSPVQETKKKRKNPKQNSKTNKEKSSSTCLSPTELGPFTCACALVVTWWQSIKSAAWRVRRHQLAVS